MAKLAASAVLELVAVIETLLVWLLGFGVLRGLTHLALVIGLAGTALKPTYRFGKFALLVANVALVVVAIPDLWLGCLLIVNEFDCVLESGGFFMFKICPSASERWLSLLFGVLWCLKVLLTGLSWRAVSGAVKGVRKGQIAFGKLLR